MTRPPDEGAAAAAGGPVGGQKGAELEQQEEQSSNCRKIIILAGATTTTMKSSEKRAQAQRRKQQQRGRQRLRQITTGQQRQQRRRNLFVLVYVFICFRCLRMIVREGKMTNNSTTSIIESALRTIVQEESSQGQEDEDEECRSGSSKIPFNVRTDLNLRPFILAVESENTTSSSSNGNPQRQQLLPITAHRCVQARGGFRRPRRDYYRASEWQRRTCLYENLYFHPPTETFYYYYHHDNKKKKDMMTTETYDEYYGGDHHTDHDVRTASGYLVAEENVTHPTTRVGKFHRFIPILTDGDGDVVDGRLPVLLPPEVQVLQKKDGATTTPKIHPNKVAVVEEPTANIDPVFVLYKPSYDFNFGHFLNDDVFSVFTMLDFFGYTTTTTAARKNPPRCHRAQSRSRRTYQHIPVHLEQNHGERQDPFWRCRRDRPESGRWNICAKMLKRVMAGLLGIRPDVIQNVTTTTTTTTTIATATTTVTRTASTTTNISSAEEVDIARTSNLFGPPPHTARDDNDNDNGSGSGGGSTTATTSTPAALPQHDHQYLVSLPEGTELVLLPAVIAGPGHLAAASCAGECVLHRASQMERFRNWMFHNVFEGKSAAATAAASMSSSSIGRSSSLSTPSPQKKTQEAESSSSSNDNILITVSLAVGNSHGPEYVCPFEERIVPALERHFRHHHHGAKLTVVDMSSLSLQKQVGAVASSTIFITNQGGGAATILFLRRGATAVLFYNSTTEEKKFNIDSNLYGTVGGYINVEWADKNDYCGVTDGGDNERTNSAAVRDFVLLVEDLIHSNHQIQQIQQQQQQRQQQRQQQ